MNKANPLLLAIIVGYVLTGCSTQQTSQQTQVFQNTPQSQGVVAAPSVSAKNTQRVAVRPSPITKPKVVSVKAKSSSGTKPSVAVTRSTVTPVAPRVQTVKKPTPTPPATQTPWQRREYAMGRMQSWSMGGRAALRFKGNAWTFGLNWLQRNKQQYSLQIRNPITGTVVGILEQGPGKSTLRTRGKVYTGPDAERLLEQQLGVKMPVNGMPYWIRGVMAPQYPIGQVVLDAKGRPKKIIQAGWVMEYFNYKGLGFDALPGKVNISRKQEQVNVRVLTKQWKTR